MFVKRLLYCFVCCLCSGEIWKNMDCLLLFVWLLMPFQCPMCSSSLPIAGYLLYIIISHFLHVSFVQVHGNPETHYRTPYSILKTHRDAFSTALLKISCLLFIFGVTFWTNINVTLPMCVNFWQTNMWSFHSQCYSEWTCSMEMHKPSVILGSVWTDHMHNDGCPLVGLHYPS